MDTIKPLAWCIIPARGGSKGIPRKNLRLLAGRPLIVHAIASAQSSKVNRVIVSTDDAEIARIAQNAGAETISRPEALSGDTASSEAAILHALQSMADQGHSLPDWTVFLQCTSPLTEASDINAMLEKATAQAADCVVSLVPFLHFLWEPNAIGSAELTPIRHPLNRRPMRQERLGHEYLETGNLYVFRTQRFLDEKTRFFGKIVGFEIPKEKYLEIDDPFDLEIADFLIRNRDRKLREMQN